MAIKKQVVVTQSEFQDALEYLRASVSEIAKETGIPRAYLSDLKTRGVALRRDYDGKLRGYLEGSGVEFEASSPGAGEGAPASPHSRLKTITAPRCYFPIADDVPDAVVAGTMDVLEENDARLAALLDQAVARNDGLFGDKGFTEETKAALQEAGNLLAENYLLSRMLRGWRAFGVKAGAEGVETLRDVLREAYRVRLEELGLIIPREPVEADSEREAA